MTEEISKEEIVKVGEKDKTVTMEGDGCKEQVEVKKEETININTDNGDLEATEGVKERLKFFFSDANIRQDRFMRKLLMDSDEKSVAVDVLLRFNTIKEHTKNAATVIQAAKQLTDSLVVDDEKMTIGRVVPFTKERMDDNIPKSLYVRNLPINESKQYDVEGEEIRALFNKYGDIALVKLKFSTPYLDSNKNSHYGPSKRRRIPTGAALVEFYNQEDLEKAAEATLTTKGGEKVEPRDRMTLAESESRKSATNLDVILLSEYVAKRKEEKEKKGDKKRSEPEPVEEKEIPKFTIDWKPNCVIKVRGLPEACDREAMLSAIGKGLDISPDEVKARKIYVDYSRGQKDGAIRFPEPSDSVAKVAKDLKDGEINILDNNVEDAFVLEGDEEKKYWEEFIEFKNKQLIQRAGEKKNSRGNKRQKTGR